MRAAVIVVIALVATTHGATEVATPVAVEEVRRIAAAHQNLKAFDLRIDVWLGSSGATEPLTATVKCDGEGRCLRIFQQWTMLETPPVSLVVDAREQVITVMRGKVAPVNWPALDPDQMLQAWLKRGGQVSGGDPTPDGRRWAFDRPDATGPPAAIYVDERTHLVRRLVYGDTQPGGAPTLVDIRYTWGDASAIAPAAFDVGRFLVDQGGNLTTAGGYAGYRIVQTDHR